MDELSRREARQALVSPQAVGRHVGGVAGYFRDGGWEADGLRHASAQHLIKGGQDMVDHRVRETGVDADEEGVGGDQVGVVQAADDAVLDVLVGRVAQEVAAEEVAGLDAGGFKGADDIGMGERDSGRTVIT